MRNKRKLSISSSFLLLLLLDIVSSCVVCKALRLLDIRAKESGNMPDKFPKSNALRHAHPKVKFTSAIGSISVAVVSTQTKEKKKTYLKIRNYFT